MGRRQALGSALNLGSRHPLGPEGYYVGVQWSSGVRQVVLMLCLISVLLCSYSAVFFAFLHFIFHNGRTARTRHVFNAHKGGSKYNRNITSKVWGHLGIFY